MKTIIKAALTLTLISGLAGCETIDEDRYASVECKDLKQLISADNLSALSQPQDTGLYRAVNDRENRQREELFDLSDDDKKRDAELRAAHRKYCR